jgi:hypothetical protein
MQTFGDAITPSLTASRTAPHPTLMNVRPMAGSNEFVSRCNTIASAAPRLGDAPPLPRLRHLVLYEQGNLPPGNRTLSYCRRCVLTPKRRMGGAAVTGDGV